jgi:hypothetical protein
MRTRIMNQLQALAMNEGRRWKSKLWSEQGRAELEKLAEDSSGGKQRLGHISRQGNSLLRFCW